MTWNKPGGFGGGFRPLGEVKPPAGRVRAAGKLPCPNCGGEGMVLYQPPPPQGWMGIHPPTPPPKQWIKCNGCNGTGEVDDPRI